LTELAKFRVVGYPEVTPAYGYAGSRIISSPKGSAKQFGQLQALDANLFDHAESSQQGAHYSYKCNITFISGPRLTVAKSFESVSHHC